LRRILANIVQNHVRDQLYTLKRGGGKEISWEAIERSSARVEAWLAAEQSSPSDQALHNEQLLQLTDALEKLPDAQRDAIVVHHLQGHSVEEVGVIMNRSRTAVAGLIKRGLQQLRRQLSKGA
jgi:RNA polymerase sigma-70 factor (ECF subfamily)